MHVTAVAAISSGFFPTHWVLCGMSGGSPTLTHVLFSGGHFLQSSVLSAAHSCSSEASCASGRQLCATANAVCCPRPVALLSPTSLPGCCGAVLATVLPSPSAGPKGCCHVNKSSHLHGNQPDCSTALRSGLFSLFSRQCFSFC